MQVEPRADSRGMCSGCKRPGPGYDRLAARRVAPPWGFKVFLRYAPRQVDCRDCGVRVERLPWASGKHQPTDAHV